MSKETVQLEVDLKPIESAKEKSVSSVILASFNVYAPRPLLGSRNMEDGAISEKYLFLSYWEVKKKVLALYKGYSTLGLCTKSVVGLSKTFSYHPHLFLSDFLRNLMLG
eukprot:TRINITY_DN23107_c0_g1_i1.p1 TRINITY_DN23107_c0_g1~~TRINITY_DN23107_c0_g1_i1.p1  ORF type:complete len:109 (-),score=15.22 TRINITY_DN23107_c0_g1_i1:400-726(-)